MDRLTVAAVHLMQDHVIKTKNLSTPTANQAYRMLEGANGRDAAGSGQPDLGHP